MTESYFETDIAAHPYLLVLPTVRFSAKREKIRKLAIFWHGDFPTGRSQTVYGGNTPWRLLLRKAAVAGEDLGARRPSGLSHFEIRMGEHALLIPDSRQNTLTDSSTNVKVVAVIPEREAAIARAAELGCRVLVAEAAIIGYSDYGAGGALSWDCKTGATRFSGGSIDI